MFQQTNPKYLFVSQTEAEQKKMLLERFEKGEASADVDDKQLWEARAVKEAVFHPDTGKQIFPLFRFCAFSPSNIVIATAMLQPAVIASPTLTLLVHWLNQSYNAAINSPRRPPNSVSSQQYRSFRPHLHR